MQHTEWDILAQNPFLAFYQRWPWYTQHTPFINLWNTLLLCAFKKIFFSQNSNVSQSGNFVVRF